MSKGKKAGESGWSLMERSHVCTFSHMAFAWGCRWIPQIIAGLGGSDMAGRQKDVFDPQQDQRSGSCFPSQRKITYKHTFCCFLLPKSRKSKKNNKKKPQNHTKRSKTTKKTTKGVARDFGSLPTPTQRAHEETPLHLATALGDGHEAEALKRFTMQSTIAIWITTCNLL